MGLDWNPLGRPKPGKEEQFERLFLELQDDVVPPRRGLLRKLRAPRKLGYAERMTRLEAFHTLCEPPDATLGAPRVGYHPEADAWLRERVEASGAPGELDQARRRMHGYYVLDLLPTCDGFPRYTNAGAYEGVDRYTFRAQFLGEVRRIIGPVLHERAWDRMLARELLAYADDLEEVARPWAARAGVAGMDGAAEAPPFRTKDPASQAHLLFSAIRWCRFWGGRGHGLDPYY